jgi:regulator of replication initiation timing
LEGGYDLKKNFKTYALVIVLIFTTIAIIDNLRISNVAEDLQKDKDNLVKQVANFEQDLGNSSNNLEELKKENELLTEDIFDFKKEVDALKSPVNYQDFIDAISAVESYKDAESFNRAKEFFAFSKDTGFSTAFSTIDSAGNCPCGISFRGGGIEWIPNTVLELKEFRIEREKIFLTYKTVESIRRDYQFVMTKTKTIGFSNNYKVEKWGIEEIKLKVNEN